MERARRSGEPMPCDIILCDRHPEVRALLAGAMQDYGYEVAATASPTQAANWCAQDNPAPLLVADLERLESLASGDTPSFTEAVGVVALIDQATTARALDAFRAGAHALLLKPVDTALLLAQVRALLARRPDRHRPIRFDRFLLDTSAETLHYEQQPVPLTPTEFSLLATLAHHPRALVPKKTLARAVWGHTHVSADALRTHIHGLRRKLDAHRPGFLITVRGRGYRLDP